MYKPYYNLSADPFSNGTAGEYLWFSEKQKAILGGLKRNILEKRGILLLTGRDGIGKSAIVEALVLKTKVKVNGGRVAITNTDKVEFYNSVLAGFNLEVKVSTKIQFYIQITDLLNKTKRKNQIGLLVVDNSHLLSQELLEEIRHISNIESGGVNLINILLVGEEGLLELIDTPKNSGLHQKLVLHCKLGGLSAKDCKQYIKHRLAVAGSEERFFTEKAISYIHRYSNGINKNINSLCETALILGHRRDKKTIDDKIIGEAAKRLRFTDVELDKAGKSKKTSRPLIETIITEHNVQSEQEADVLKGVDKRNWSFLLVGSSLAAIISLFFIFPELVQFPLDQEDDNLPLHSKVEIVEVKDSEPVPVTVRPHPVIKEKISVEKLEVIKVTQKELKVEDVALAPVNSKENITPENHVVAVLEEIQTTQIKQSLASASAEDDMVKDRLVDQEKWLNDTGKVTLQNNLSLAITEDDKTEIAQNESKSKILDILPIVSQVESKKTAVSEIVNGGPTALAPAKMLPLEQVAPPIELHADSKKKIVLIPYEKLVLETKPNSSEITPEARKNLDKLTKILLFHPEAELLVEGYIASHNNSVENIRLSEKRANIVKDYLIQGGIPEHLVTVKGRGNENPLGDNSTRQGRRKNRRVEVTVLSDPCHKGHISK